VEDIAVSPVAGDRLLAWTGGLLYRSTDAGQNWSYVPAQFLREGASPPLRNLRFDPANVDGAWASIATRIVHSTDFGRTWGPWGAPVPGDFLENFELDTSDPATVWAAMSGGLDRGVWRTTDAGATWEPRREGLLLANVRSIAARPGQPGTLVAGTADGLARTTDAGATWTWVRVGPTSAHVKWDAGGSLVRAYQGDLVESTDAGATWRAIPSDIVDGVEPYAFDPLDPAQLLLANITWCGGGYQYGHYGSTRRSTNGGDTWTREDLTGCLYYGYYYGSAGTGVARIGDTAWSWIPQTPAAPLSLQRTTDGGETWEYATAGMKELPLQVFDADAAGDMYVRDGYGIGNHEAFRRSTDRGVTWPTVNEGSFWEADESRFLLASRTRAGDLLEGGWGFDIDYGWEYVARSTDAGSSWQVTLYPGWGVPHRAAFDHGSGGVIYLWNGNSEWGPPSATYLSRSDDGNVTYEDLGESPFIPVAALIAPEDDSEVFAATLDAEPVVRTTDAGLSWHARSDGLPGDRPVALLMDPANGDYLVVAFERGIPWESTDRGASWRPLASGLDPARSIPEEIAAPPDLELRGVQVLNADWDLLAGQRRVFLSTDQGIWASDLGFLGTKRPQVAFEWIRYSRATGLLTVASRRHGIFAIDLTPIGLQPGPATSAPAIAGFAPLSLAPNPFVGSASIRFGLGRAGSARVDVYDPAGRRVATLVDGRLAAGGHAYTWSGRNDAGRSVAPGVYFVRLTTADQQATRRIVRLR